MNDNDKDRFMNRFAYIETELFWGEGVTAGQLARTFRISRQMAQRIINLYREQHPEQMHYVKKNKRHEATGSFQPLFIRSSSNAFLDYLRGQTLVGLYRDEENWDELGITDVDRFLRPDLPFAPVRTIVAGLRREKAVAMDYRKKDLEPGGVSMRVVSPNHLIYADGRCHIRAYCHNKKRYLDFVLSRIVHAEICADDWISSDYDKEWNEFAELRLKPNPALPSSVQEAVLRGFEGKESGVRIIKCRKALLYYIERRLFSIDSKYGMPLWIPILEKKT